MRKGEKKFIEGFVNLYVDYRFLEFKKIQKKITSDERKKFREFNDKINLSLRDYPILFKDVNLLEKVFTKTVLKENSQLFAKTFVYFLNWIVDRLRKQKVISKKDYNILKTNLRKLEISKISIWPITG